jgi:undecaprenyl-diphosphatase
MDRDIVLWFADHRAAPLDVAAVVLAVAGTAGLIWILLGIVAGLTRSGGFLRITVPVAVAVWAADLAALGLRHLIGRQRPYDAVAGLDAVSGVGGTGPGFPSGHATVSAAGAVALILLLRRAAPALAGLALLIAASRVYAGVHYPTDALAGLLLGCAFGTAGAALGWWFAARAERA